MKQLDGPIKKKTYILSNLSNTNLQEVDSFNKWKKNNVDIYMNILKGNNQKKNNPRPPSNSKLSGAVSLALAVK